MNAIVNADRAATLAINSWNCPVGDIVWLLFSNVQIWYAAYLVVTVFLFLRLGWRRGLVSLLAIVLTVVACDQFANLVKFSVARLRPCNDPDMLEAGLHVLEEGGPFGFFSAHAANSFGFALASLLCFRKDDTRSYRAYGIGVFLWAALVSVSRVFVGKHFLGDVLVGTMVGLLISFLICRLADFLYPQIFKNK